MCGICGFISQNKIGTEDAIAMWRRNESRGGHAHGWATVKEWYKKEGKIPTEIIVPKTNLIIMHTRFTTHGSASKNANNHPHFAGNWAIVHNGILSGAHENQRTECDSEQIAKYLLQYERSNPIKAIRKMVKQLEGYFRIAIIHKMYPDKLWIVNDSENIHLGYSTKKILYFASETKDIPIHCWMGNTGANSINEFSWELGELKWHRERFRPKTRMFYAPRQIETRKGYNNTPIWETAVCIDCQQNFQRIKEPINRKLETRCSKCWTANWQKKREEKIRETSYIKDGMLIKKTYKGEVLMSIAETPIPDNNCYRRTDDQLTFDDFDQAM